MEVVSQFQQSMGDEETRELVLLYMSQVGIFNGLSPNQLLALVQRCEARSYEAREMIFTQDTGGTDLHLVLEGSVELFRKLTTGEGRQIATREKGSSFGEIGFITGASRTLSAVNGTGPSLQLVLSRTEFDGVVQADPQIGFVVFQQLLETMSNRMDWLPPMYRNYLMWGYRPPDDPSAGIGEAPNISKSKVLGLTGGAGGLVGGLLLGLALSSLGAGGSLTLPVLAGISGLAIGAGGFIAGSVIGAQIEKQEESWIFQRKHPRSCANCKFVIWKEGGETPDCFYKVEKMLQVTFKPGLSFDTYTDCPSFDPVQPEEKVRAQKRDTMGKD
jgi:hypothetical protein